MNMFDTTTLNKVINAMKEPSTFLLDVFFPHIQPAENGDESISFDVDKTKPQIAAFVAPFVKGKVTRNKGYITKKITPAYVKDKRIFNSKMALKRVKGETIGGNLSGWERQRIRLAQHLELQLNALTLREVCMARDLMLSGKTTIVGEDYPTVEVDFGRETALTKTLSGGSAWGQEGVSPYDDVEAHINEIGGESGYFPNIVVMDPLAWKDYIADSKVKDAIDVRRGGDSTVKLGHLLGKARYMGTVGQVEIYVYQEKYLDENENVQQMMPDNTVLLGGEGIEGARGYGAIHDEESGFVADRYFSKSWVEHEGPRNLLLQSAPLPILYRPNASGSITTK